MEKHKCGGQVGIQMAMKVDERVYTTLYTKSLILILTSKPNLFLQLYSLKKYQHLINVWIKSV